MFLACKFSYSVCHCVAVFQLKEVLCGLWSHIVALAALHPNELMETITASGEHIMQGTMENPVQSVQLIISTTKCREISLQLVLQQELIEIGVCMLAAAPMHITDAILSNLSKLVDHMAYQIVVSRIVVQK